VLKEIIIWVLIAPKGPIAFAPSLQKRLKIIFMRGAPDRSGALPDRVHVP
jgi:hypothetical protein